MSELFEIGMIVLFGLSWPISAIKSYKSQTTKGQSLAFLLFIFVGYICGILSKLLANSYKWYVLFFYILNFITVGANLIIYYRNYKIDKRKEK